MIGERFFPVLPPKLPLAAKLFMLHARRRGPRSFTYREARQATIASRSTRVPDAIHEPISADDFEVYEKGTFSWQFIESLPGHEFKELRFAKKAPVVLSLFLILFSILILEFSP